MEKKPRLPPKGGKQLSHGMLKKQKTINNNSLAKNLNHEVKGKKEAAAAAVQPLLESTTLPQGCTPLMYACQQADHNLVEEILRKEPQGVFKKDRTLKTALHYCFDNPNAVTADRILMAAPSLLEARDQDGFTALHLAVIQGNMPLVNFLLANNADVMALDNEKHSVVHWATVCGEVEALRAVLAAGADAGAADVHGGRPLHYAAQMCGASGGAGSRLALDILGALLRAPAARPDAPDADGRQPLLWAASAGSAPAILALIKAGASVESPDKDGLTALHCAASRGHTECIETLLTLCGARSDIIDSNGCTALHYAVTLGHADATALLLEQGADPNRQDRKGRSPAHCGCAKGQLETVRMLGARNANLWLRNAKGDLPLHEAVASGRRELVKWLLDMRPSQVNATNNDGRTLLHIAANSDNTDLCKILLDFGGQINAVLRTPKNVLLTPLDCALHKGFRSTAKYLQLHGGLPASRLNSREVMVNQEVVPQQPVRHIKTTKIQLKDRVAIEKKEIFEMSPRGTPVRRYSGKVNTLSDISQDSSSDYETENRRLREERRRHSKKHKTRRDSSKYRSRDVSFSEDYDSDGKRRRHKAISDTESSGKNEGKRDKRSKSEPSSQGKKNETSKQTPKKQKHIKIEIKSSESEKEVLKKRRRKSGSRKSDSDSRGEEKNDTQSNKSKNKESALETTTTIDLTTTAREHVQDIEMLKHAAEIVKNIEMIESKNDRDSLESIIHGHVSEDTLPQITMMVTEAQVHAESHLSYDQETTDGRNTSFEKDTRSDTGIAAVIDDKKPSISLVENYANISEEKIEPEMVDENVNLSTRDGIIAIIPDIPEGEDELPTSSRTTDGAELRSEEIDSNKGGNEPGIVQAIIGILPDEDKQIEDSDNMKTNDDIMGEAVEETIQRSPSKRVTLIGDEEYSDREGTESKSYKTFTSEDQKRPYIQQDSEETTAGISELSLKTDVIQQQSSEDKTIPDDSESLVGVEKGVQKVFASVEPIDKPTKRSVKQQKQLVKTIDGGRKLYETQSYKILPDSEGAMIDEEIGDYEEEPDRFVKQAGYTRRRAPSVSDNEMYTVVDSSGTLRRRRKKKYKDKVKIETMRSKSQNSERDYESSVMIDSGFEPSPRFIHQNRAMSPRLVAYYQDRNATGLYSSKFDSKIPKRKPGDKNAVEMNSVTQIVQTNMRRYFLERKIFQHLMDLKRIQIRSSKANEAMLVKRAIDDYHKSSLVHVGAGRYTSSDYTYKSFEKFLYDSLRKLQRTSAKHLANLPERQFPEFVVGKDNENTYRMEGLPDNPILCTSKTHRCFHAVHAYTGIPCSAYIPRMNHHTMPKPGAYKKSFLPDIKKGKSPSGHVTLELCHGNEKQMIALPSEKLDKNKRYYVTFTVKGGSNNNSDTENLKPANPDGASSVGSLNDPKRNVKTV